MELCSMLCVSLDGRGAWGRMGTYLCMAESLHCSSETMTTLLIGCQVASVVSDSVQSHRRQLTRLPRPWDSPGKNTGVGCHFLLQCMKVKMKVKSLSRVHLFATPWTAAYQALPSTGFSRQEYWSRLPLPSPVNWLYLNTKCFQC